jgi:Translationally controlled tumour protein
MCESKMISKNNDEVDVGCGNAFGGEGAEEAGRLFINLHCFSNTPDFGHSRTVACKSIETLCTIDFFFSGGADAAAMVNNVVDGFQYTETQIGTASDFKAWIKDYMNAVVLKLRDKKKPKEDIQAFKASAPGIAKFFLSQFSDVQFFLTASFNAETMVFSIYPEGALTPNFYYIMGGLAAEKF